MAAYRDNAGISLAFMQRSAAAQPAAVLRAHPPGLFRLGSRFELAIPAEIGTVLRALATLEGTLTQLDPEFDIAAEARQYAAAHVTGQLSPAAVQKTAADELLALLPVLRRLPRRVDRITGALEQGRLSVNVRLFTDDATGG
jgi:ubiquinone biosynthesis protein